MKKRTVALVISLTLVFIFVVLFLVSDQMILKKENELDDALRSYREFLLGERMVESKSFHGDIKDIFRFDTQINRDWNRYALFDMNGDGIPELLIWSIGTCKILTYKNGKLIHWASFWSYSKPLNNRAVLTQRPGGANLCITYIYQTFDFYGNEQLKVNFEKGNPNKEGIYDENSDYLFEGIKVSKEEWEDFTDKYLSVGSDEIEWFTYSENGELAF